MTENSVGGGVELEIKDIVTRDIEVFPHTATISEVAASLQKNEKRSGIVFRNKKYLGVVEKRRLVSARVNPTEATLEQYTHKAPLLKSTTSVVEAARLMVDNDVDALPVEENKEIIGVVEMVPLARLIADLPEAQIPVGKAKYLKSVKVNKDDSLPTAIEVMHQEHADHLPVFDKGSLYGVLSYKDIIRKHLGWSPRRDTSSKFNTGAGARSAKLVPEQEEFSVAPFVTTGNLISVKSKNTLKEAVELMQKHRISSVLVMDDSKYQGLLSARNVLETVSRQKKVKRYNIGFIGLNSAGLTEHQQNVMQEIIEREADRLQRLIPEQFSIAVHLKTLNKEGKQREYSLKLRVDTPGNMFTATKEDWDLETALHKCFNVVKVQLDH